MTTITEFVETFQHVFGTKANELAKKTGFIRRERAISGEGFAQALVLGGLAQPEGTYKQLHHFSTQVGMRVSVQGLDQRFTEKAVEFMRGLLVEALNQLVQAEHRQVILPQFNGIYITDCSRLVWAEMGGVKIGIRLEIQRGQLQGCVLDLTSNDQTARVIETALPVGSLHLADLGLFKLERFQRWDKQGVCWLTRYKVGVNLYDEQGQPLVLASLLHGDQALSLPVRVGSGRHQVRAHLLAAPLPPAALAKREARLKEQARLNQRPLSPQQREIAAWTIYLTNVPALSFEQAHMLGRTRWQIENLFKLWKSHGHVLTSHAHHPLRQQCEGYAKLIAMLLAHWMLLVAGWQQDRLGALDALRILRTHIPHAARAFYTLSRWHDFFDWLACDLQLAPRLSKRRKVPLAFQLWYALEDSFVDP